MDVLERYDKFLAFKDHKLSRGNKYFTVKELALYYGDSLSSQQVYRMIAKLLEQKKITEVDKDKSRKYYKFSNNGRN